MVLELVDTNLYVLILLLVNGYVFEWVWELAPTMVHWRHNLIWIQFIEIKVQQQLVGWLVLDWFKSIDWPAQPADPEQPNRAWNCNYTSELHLQATTIQTIYGCKCKCYTSVSSKKCTGSVWEMHMFCLMWNRAWLDSREYTILAFVTPDPLFISVYLFMCFSFG